MKTAIVSSADAKFFGLLMGLLDSIERQRPAGGEPLDICVMDVGLTAEQRAVLEKRVARIVEPGWDYSGAWVSKLARYFQAQLARPHLPKHFPGYERYVWLDADVWLQDWHGMEMLLKASEQPVMAIVPEVHHGYQHIFGRRPQMTKALKLIYETSYGEETGKWLATLPVINSGVFAMRAELVYWRNWGDALGRAGPKLMAFLTEQCALNMAIYTGLVAWYPLPATCNWICSEAPPLFDPVKCSLHSPLAPHERISIVHLVNTKDKNPEVKGMDGVTRTMSLSYPSVTGCGGVKA